MDRVENLPLPGQIGATHTATFEEAKGVDWPTFSATYQGQFLQGLTNRAEPVQRVSGTATSAVVISMLTAGLPFSNP